MTTKHEKQLTKLESEHAAQTAKIADLAASLPALESAARTAWVQAERSGGDASAAQKAEKLVQDTRKRYDIARLALADIEAEIAATRESINREQIAEKRAAYEKHLSAAPGLVDRAYQKLVEAEQARTELDAHHAEGTRLALDYALTAGDQATANSITSGLVKPYLAPDKALDALRRMKRGQAAWPALPQWKPADTRALLFERTAKLDIQERRASNTLTGAEAATD